MVVVDVYLSRPDCVSIDVIMNSSKEQGKSPS